MTLALDGVGGHHHAPAAFTPRKDPIPIVQEAGWAPGLVWIGVENLAPTGIRCPDLPACSKSLYQVQYPGPNSLEDLALNAQKFTISCVVTGAAICD